MGGRIRLLDSFRCIAILMVILDHYTATFTKEATVIFWPHISKSLYPYGDRYAPFFQKGYLGVQLFFMISGFVIYLTLEKSTSIQKFLWRRFLRLFPLLFICSVITYTVPFFLDTNKHYLLFHRPVQNFLPSLTFTELWIWNALLKVKNVEFIDNAYWTLGVEMKYYIYAALIYFFSKKRFFANWLKFNLVVFIAYAIILILATFHFTKTVSIFKKILEIEFFTPYLIYFTLGSLFYRMYESIKIQRSEFLLCGLLMLLCLDNILSYTDFIAMLLFCGLFLIFIYKPNYLSLLLAKPIIAIGVCSYPLYLIHQNAGILLINFISDELLMRYPEILILPVIIIFILIAYFMHKKIEVPISRLLKKYST